MKRIIIITLASIAMISIFGTTRMLIMGRHLQLQAIGMIEGASGQDPVEIELATAMQALRDDVTKLSLFRSKMKSIERVRKDNSTIFEETLARVQEQKDALAQERNVLQVSLGAGEKNEALMQRMEQRVSWITSSERRVHDLARLIANLDAGLRELNEAENNSTKHIREVRRQVQSLRASNTTAEMHLQSVRLIHSADLLADSMTDSVGAILTRAEAAIKTKNARAELADGMIIGQLPPPVNTSIETERSRLISRCDEVLSSNHHQDQRLASSSSSDHN